MKYLKLKFLLMFFALAMAIPPAWAETVTLTQSVLGLTGSYSANTEKTVDGITYQHTDLMKNNDNIQAKASTGTIFNTTAYPGNITSVAITHSGTARATTISGSSDGTNWSQVATGSGSITGDFSGKGYKYFKITRGSNAAYWTKIEITYQSGTVLEQVATPTFSLATGTYTSVQNVEIACATGGATIYYTTDGTTPTTTSTEYTGAITVNETMTLKAIAVKSGMDNSAVASATYTINLPPEPSGIIYKKVNSMDLVDGGTYVLVYEGDPAAAMGEVSKVSGHGTKGTSVTGIILDKTTNPYQVDLAGKNALTLIAHATNTPGRYAFEIATDSYLGCNEASFSIAATTGSTTAQWDIHGDGTVYSASSATRPILYRAGDVNLFGPYASSNINISNSEYSYAYLYAKEDNISVERVAMPTFDPAGGNYDTPQSVTISCTTDGATIHYTTDGTDPTESSTLYTSAINVDKTTTIKAIAVADDMENSYVATATYTLPVFVDNYVVANGVGENGLAANTDFTFTKTAVVVYNTGTNMWIQDENAQAGGGLIFKQDGGLDFDTGDIIAENWTATTKAYQGFNEFINFNGEKKANAHKDPIVLERETLSGENIHEYVLLKDVTITKNGENLYVIVPDSRAQLQLYTKTLGIYNDGSFTPDATKTYNVKGIVGSYQSNLQIYPIEITEFVQPGEPTITITAPEVLPFNDEGGIYTVNGSSLPTDGLGVNVSEGFDRYLENGNNEYYYFPLTNGAVTDGRTKVTYTGREFTATGTITYGSGSANQTADLSYRTDIYIITDNGVENQWNYEGTKMDYADDVYTQTIETTKPNTMILFARKASLGENERWNTRFVFGPVSDRDWGMPAGNTASGNIDVNDDDPIYFPVAGEYLITINADKTFTINKVVHQVETPVINPGTGNYNTIQTVTITAVDGATIHYTTDGTEPTESSTLYEGPITVDKTTTIKAIAVMDGMTNSEVAEATYTLPTSVNTLAAANDLVKDTEFLFTGDAVVTYHNGDYTFLRDVNAEAGGGLIYQPGINLAQGVVLKKGWDAKRDDYRGEKEYINAINVESSGNTADYTPFNRTGVVFDDTHMNEYVTFNNVTITGKTLDEGSSKYTYTGTYTDGNRANVDYILHNQFDLNNIEEGRTYNVTGVVTKRGENMQVYPTAVTLVKQDPGLAFNPTSVPASFGAEFTEPELTKPADLTGITYESNNTAVATVDENGNVDIVGVGSATITASVTESDYYLAGQASYTITVSKANAKVEYSAETATATFGAEATLPTVSTTPADLPLTYESTNTDVATVNENGEVDIVGAGETTIKAIFAGNGNYNEASDSYTLTVGKADPKVEYSAETATATFGAENVELPTLTVTPNDLKVTYSSTNTDVATVDNDGKVTIKGAGTTTISAAFAGNDNYNEASDSYVLTVSKADAVVEYSAENASATFGAEATLPTLTVSPNDLEVTYSSTNTAVATVGNDGKVTIVSVGTTTISAAFAGNNNYNEASDSYVLTVTAATPTFAYSADAKEVVFGAENPELPTLSNPNNLTVTYTSSKPAVATVNAQGEVTIVGAGTTTITATGAATGNYAGAVAQYTLTVSKADLEVSFNETPDPITIGDSFTAPVLSEVPEGTTVTYKSSNENVAKVNATTGEVEIVGVGSAIITATVTGANYNETSATYTITVNDVEVAIAAPTFAPAAGTYTEAKEVAIACATPGVTITYAIDGVDKGEYNGPFTISDGEHTVTATAKMGTRTVYTPATSSATYTINAADAATIADDYYFLQSNAAEVSGKYANVAGRRTLNFVADADKQAGTVFRVMTDPDTIGQVETLRSQAVDLQGYANRAMAYVPKVIDLVLSTLANSSLGDPETPGTGILGENGLDLILNKFYEGFDYNLYVEQADGGYRIFGRTPSMQHVVDFYHENTAQVEEKLPMLEGYINQVLDKIRNKIPAPYDANVVVPFSLKTVRDRIADKYGIALIDPTQDLMGFYRQVLNNKEYVWDFAYQTAMMYVDVIKETQTYKNLPDEYKLFVEKMEKVRPDTKYYIIERGNELDYISENNGDIIKNDPRTLWTLTKRENFTVNVPEDNKLNDSYYTTLYTDFGYELPTGVKAYAVTGIDENDVAQLTEITGAIPAQTPVLLKADADGDKVLTLKKENRGGAIEDNLLEGPDYLITKYQIKTPAVVSLFNMAQGFVPADVLAAYEYLQLRYSGTVNNKYFWNVNSDLEDLQGDCVVRSLAVKDNELAFSEHWKTETNKAFLVSDTKPVIYLEKDTLAAPTFSPVPGSYTVDNGQNVTITITAEDGATIYYKIGDGEYQRYNGPITASDDMTIVAKAEKDGMIASNEVTAVYVIDIPAELPTITPFKGYYQIKNNGNNKYANIAGRKTLNFTNDIDKAAGTVIRLETDEHGKVDVLRSQAADLQRYADRVVEYYVPKAVELVVEKLHADGAGNILGENGLDAIMDKFNESFDHHLYVEPAEGGYRIYGKTPSMQPVVDFYREHTAQVEAKLPMLESFINSALNKLKEKIGGSSVFTPFSLLNIWERMGGTLTKPENDASIMAFYREVLNNKNYVWDFAYQTAMIYLNNIKGTQTYQNLVNEHPEISQYIDKIDQIRPDFKYYIVQKDDKPDFISQGNVDIINNEARTIWTVEPRTTFTVNIAGEMFGCPLATNGVGGYFTTNYTDFAYTLPEGVTAYKVTGVNDEGEATLEALSGTIPAQTPVLLVAKEDKPYELTLTTDAGTAVTSNLLVGPDYLINEYDLKTAQVQGIFDMIKQKLGQDFYNNYVAQYEHLADLNSGTVNNKYFWNVNSYLDYCTYKNANNEDECVVRSLATNENGELAFSEHWKTETNKAFLVSDTFDVITLPSLERGDVNHDGFVNLIDVTDLIDRLLVIPDAEHLKACPYCSDVDGNGSVSIKDVTVLIDILLENPATEPEGGDGN